RDGPRRPDPAGGRGGAAARAGPGRSPGASAPHPLHRCGAPPRPASAAAGWRGRSVVESSIGHLRCRYRVVGGPGAGARAASVTSDRIADAWQRVLAAALDGDDSVYVIRNVRASFVHVAPSQVDEAGLADRVGAHLAAAVLRIIAGGPDAGDNLVRFVDTGE